jgi:hypothetical protein
MPSGIRTTRRALLVGTGAGLAGAMAAGAVAAHATDSLQDDVFAAATIVLQDARLPLPADVRARLDHNGARVITLEADPVRMWRGELAPILDRRDTRMLGVTRWTEFLLIQGLAAESRRRVHYQRFDAATDTMVWLIA